MQRLDRRGTAALEFCLVGAAFFLLLFAVIELGRYAITVQSLRTLAGAGARAIMMDACYVNNVLKKQTPTGCPTDPLPTTKADIAPFLFYGGLSPTLSASSGSSPITVTAQQPGFTMLFPVVWGTSLNAPAVTTKIPY
jgi:Flp pilus assembly protein TadG